MLSSILTTGNNGAMTLESFLICLACTLVLGIINALIYTFKNHYTKSFVVSLTLLPMMVQVVIALVNGNLGVAVAVTGSFTLIRFRSVTAGGRELTSIFMAMAIGLAGGMGYVGVAAILVVVVGLMEVLLMTISFGEGGEQKELRITVPENLDFNGVFDDIFKTYTKKCEQIKVKTANMGEVYQLYYCIILKDETKTKEFMDAIRTRNGNLNVAMEKLSQSREEL